MTNKHALPALCNITWGSSRISKLREEILTYIHILRETIHIKRKKEENNNIKEEKGKYIYKEIINKQETSY